MGWDGSPGGRGFRAPYGANNITVITKMKLISMVGRNEQRVEESLHRSWNNDDNKQISEQGGRTMVWLLICLCWNDDHHNYDPDYNDDDKWDVEEDDDDVLRINGSLSNALVLLCLDLSNDDW